MCCIEVVWGAQRCHCAVMLCTEVRHVASCCLALQPRCIAAVAAAATAAGCANVDVC